jgi:hypothetical protein
MCDVPSGVIVCIIIAGCVVIMWMHSLVRGCFHMPMPYSFHSVAHVWVPGAKATGPIAKKFFSEINTIHSVIEKMFHKGPFPNHGACQKWCFIF